MRDGALGGNSPAVAIRANGGEQGNISVVRLPRNSFVGVCARVNDSRANQAIAGDAGYRYCTSIGLVDHDGGHAQFVGGSSGNNDVVKINLPLIVTRIAGNTGRSNSQTGPGGNATFGGSNSNSKSASHSKRQSK